MSADVETNNNKHKKTHENNIINHWSNLNIDGAGAESSMRKFSNRDQNDH